MSTARHHAEWLSLTEVSGPFLSLPVLLRVFPQGLDAHDQEHYRLLRTAFEEWQDNQASLRPNPAIHQEWIRYVLQETLAFSEEVLKGGQALPPGLEAYIAEHHETLRPDLAVVNPDGRPDAGKPRLLIRMLPPGQNLERAIEGEAWKASPATRMMELLHATEVKLGLVTNGEQWMLVHAPRGETSSFVTWYASLWFEEQLTLRAFRSLLDVHRFFAVADEDTLEALFAESAQNQQEVTDQLGYQVRKAVEVLVQALDRQDKDRGRQLLAGVEEKRIYEAALTVMMRLVFLFSAEERGLLLLGDPLYDQYYAVSTLRGQLREDADRFGEEVLERRHDAWCRLLATFRAVYGGIKHDRLQLPAYGGRLFDPDRFPFLEGRARGSSWRKTAADPLPINNRTVLHLLEALQMLQVKIPGGGPAEARRLSFRALDIEQIGHVYEGLLDHSAVRAAAPVLGLQGSKDKEEEIPLAELEALRAHGEKDLLKFLQERTGRTEKALQRALTNPPLLEEQRLLVACENDRDLLARVQPFASLLREDTSGYPVVIPTGSVYVTQCGDRRSTGTHYTQRSLTEPIVQYTLEPLVYQGPAEGQPREAWQLKSAREILALKICDFAMGSGAFLVQACRYLSERLVEAWEAAESAAGDRLVITPEGELSCGAPEERPIPKDTEERLAIARRLIAERCLYGVDKNPMAAEMSKLSLWLVTLAKGKPFTFLDHALKCGDSLVGMVSKDELADSLDFYTFEGLAPLIDLRHELQQVEERDIEDVQRKERLYRGAEKATMRAKLAADLSIGPYFVFAKPAGQTKLCDDLKDRFFQVSLARARARSGKARVTDELMAEETALREKATEMLGDLRPFHWPLEFPEVFLDDSRQEGFDAILSNPPFLGGQKITGALGTFYRDYLVAHLANGKRGSADLCAYFFLRAGQLLCCGGNSGMLATNTIAQGDTREVGLEQLAAPRGKLEEQFHIIRAVPSMKWPGTANLEVAVVWGHHGKWFADYILDDKPVRGITPFLTPPGAVAGKPYRLKANEGKSFQGSIVLGMGFILTQEEARALIRKNPENEDVLFPYLNGEDLNSRPDQSANRWVINFFDWPLNRTAEGSWTKAKEDEHKRYLRAGIVPADYPDPVAADYPDCLAIVEEKVKPERVHNNRKVYRERWWHYGEKRPELYAAIAGIERAVIRTRVSNCEGIALVPNSSVFSEQTVVFLFSSYSFFTLLQATLHTAWVHHHASTLGLGIRYTPSDCYETFPFPERLTGLDGIGERYYTHRQSIMQARQEGLTKTYNRFHDPKEKGADILRLRELHVEMDTAVARTYGWEDLDLGHGFHETKQGLRYTISEEARREVLDRLLALNHARYEEEVRQGLHDKEKAKKGRGKKKGGEEDTGQTEMTY